MVTRELRQAVVDLVREAGRATMVYYDCAGRGRGAGEGRPQPGHPGRRSRPRHPGRGARAGSTPTRRWSREEAAAADFDARRGWSRFWLVDPLDGTKEFIKRRAEFTVNVALIDNGEPVLGVVRAPALDLLYWAVKGEGAWREAKGGPAERIYSTAPAPGTPLTIVESLSHPSPELEEYLKTIPVGRRVKAGSSLKFCWVAEGRADVYPRLGPTMEWDVAAGDCVFRQSGREGERPSPLTYNKPDLRNPSFVIGL